tara:strand:+ start:233 stop:391 length:159 start_codon:yes stop_codon:yes gene_type:complete
VDEEEDEEEEDEDDEEFEFSEEEGDAKLASWVLAPFFLLPFPMLYEMSEANH